MLPLYPMRLQKFLARAGVASRRGSETLISAKRVSVNGATITELGSKVNPSTDEVRVDNKIIRLSTHNNYLMLNKPAAYLTTMSDPQGRPTVAELLPAEYAAGLFPVGRLDYDTTGLLLFMTNGELAHRLLHPRYHVSKQYFAEVDGVFTEEDAALLRKGILLHDGMTKPAEVDILSLPQDERLNKKHLKQFKKLNTNERIQAAAGELPVVSTEVCITLTEGRKRQVKRMFAQVGHPVIKLQRKAFGPLQLGNLPLGNCRSLTQKEVALLMNTVDYNSVYEHKKDPLGDWRERGGTAKTSNKHPRH